MKEIGLFIIECSSEEEGWTFYFDGKGTKDKFERDVRECVKRVLNEKYRFVKVDESTFVRKKALDNKNVEKFIDWLRNTYGYKGRVWVDIEDDLVLVTTNDTSTDLSMWKRDHECSVHFFADEFMLQVKPSKVIGSEEFEKYMKEKGWEKVDIVSKGRVWFYEWGGFVQGEDEKWYNHVWNSGYREI